MKQSDMLGMLDFLRQAEQLKDTLRSAHTTQGRKESTAEHTWRLCLMAMLFEQEMPEIDHAKLMQMCVIHDLGEAISGDIAAVDQDPSIDKSHQERLDLQTLIAPLNQSMQQHILALWDEYEQAETLEAKVLRD